MIKKPVGKQAYLQFRRDRYAAFMSMDQRKLELYCHKYQVPVPEMDEVFWVVIHKARVKCPDLPLVEIESSIKWLKDHGCILPVKEIG